MENDIIKNPNHYKLSNGMEAKDIIKIVLNSQNLDAYAGFLEGNVLKYVIRWIKKNGIEDLKKASQYINMLIKYIGDAESGVKS